MNPIVFALRRPYTVMVAVAAVLVGSVLAMTRARVDIFPNLNQPVIYVCQPYAGMTPTQMEGMLTHYYEYHFLYINGIRQIESKSIQGMSLMKLEFHPGTDMAQALSEVVAAVNRSKAFMPPGAHPPFIMRLDVGSASVGYLVLSSDKLSIKEIQDIAMARVRPMFAAIPGISTPPAFGGNQRAIVVSVDPDKLRGQNLTLEQVTDAVAKGNSVIPSGNVRVGDQLYLVTTNAMIGGNPAQELGGVPVKFGESPVLLRDIATIADASDITTSYALVNGRRSVYMMVTKRSDASTLDVVNDLQAALPAMRDAAPELNVEFAFDQSPLVTRSMWAVASEGAIGAILTGLMVLLFLRDWRSVIVVVLNIPLALLAAFLALWLTGETVNIMTLGGLALAVGILVDEATVEVENIHTQLEKSDSVARAVRRGNHETAVPRLLAMLCILAVFIPSFFMRGAARELFVPLSLAVGFAMIASYLLSSTFVPVMSVWLMKMPPHGAADRPTLFSRFQRGYESVLGRLLALRGVVAPAYLLAAGAVVALLAVLVGTSVFPPTDQGQFQLRLKAPTGTRVERTEELTREAVRAIEEEAGPGNVRLTVGYIGLIPSSYPIQGVYQWTSGPEEVILKVALRPGSGVRVGEFTERLRGTLPDRLRGWLKDRWREEGVPADRLDARAAGLRLSFEPGDLISEVMSFGAPNAVEVQVSGPNLAANAGYARALAEKFRSVRELRDVQIAQAQDYPTLEVRVDREQAATAGLTVRDVGVALIPATSSSRFVSPTYWQDPKNGQSYLVQVQVPPPRMSTVTEIGLVPVRGPAGIGPGGNGHPFPAGSSGGASAGGVLLRDVATIQETTSAETVDRHDMQRMISVAANVGTTDLGGASRAVRRAIAEVGPPPKGVRVAVRGQVQSLDSILNNLAVGLGIAVLAIVLLLTAYFQSVRLALVSVSAVPATLCGVGLALWLTGTTLNLLSFMGAIMAVGVAVANAILLVTFAERGRALHGAAARAAAEGGTARLRAVLMTSGAMVAGMLPMALGIGEGAEQTAALARAVVGGVLLSTAATLLALPTVFALVQRRAGVASASLDPDDPNSRRYDVDRVQLFQ